MTFTSKNMIDIILIFDFVLLSSISATSKASTDYSDDWFVGRNQRSVSSSLMCLPSNCFTVQRFSMMSCMQCSFWSSFSNFGIITLQTFCNAQIFGDVLQNKLLFPVQLICDNFNCRSVPHYLPYSLDTDSWPSCWTPPAAGVIFHLLSTFF